MRIRTHDILVMPVSFLAAVEVTTCHYWMTTDLIKMLHGGLYFDPLREEVFGSYGKLKCAAKQTGVAQPSEVKPWLEEQDAYTVHRPERKRYPRNP
jgi:hypothetical protein